ncbi:curlin repeat-containing protein, partial [Acinetobacter baumannii]
GASFTSHAPDVGATTIAYTAGALGSNNTINVNQFGGGANYAAVSQVGSNNTATTVQNGTGNRAVVRQ